MRMLILVIILGTFLSACATTRQRVFIVNVHEAYPTQVDTASVEPAEEYRDVVREERKRKNFWKGATTVLVVLIVIELVWGF